MKVEIWCQEHLIICSPVNERVPPLRVWQGELSAVPAKGSHIGVFYGWALEIVREVQHLAYQDTVYIEIGPDTTGEYRRHLEALVKLEDGE